MNEKTANGKKKKRTFLPFFPKDIQKFRMTLTI